MAKRPEEKPFRPLDADLVHSVMQGNTAQIIRPLLSEASTNDEPYVPIQPKRLEGEVRAEPTKRSFRDGRHERSRDARRSALRPASRNESKAPLLGERLEREKRVLLVASEERAIERVVANIGAELGTSLKLSHVLRAFIRLLIDAESEIIERARATGRTIRPSNADLAGIEDFEYIIASVLQDAIRSAPPIRS